jgi:AraC-like DNA-binding protein/mannose-6-phosphate isomerase-like protein (cupin superfamily)
MDVLSDVLKAMRLYGSVFFTAEFSTPWAVVSPNATLLATIVMPDADHLSLFHILTEGECIVECDGGPAVTMQSGDVIVFPHGQPHTMRSRGDAKTTSLNQVISQRTADALPQVSLGGGGPKTRFICGYLNCDQRFGPLFSALPTVLLVRRRNDYSVVEAPGRAGREPAALPRESGRWLGTTLKFTVNEAAAGRPGNAAMLGRLTELMFVEIVREYMQQLEADDSGWLAGLKDPCVGKAMRLLHADPMRRWTVDSLAHEVAMSRSALAQRFTRYIGASPMKYLSNWRMQLAMQMLRDRSDNIQGVAARVGYESEPAFNRAFKRATGCPPAAWRRVAANSSSGH